MNTAQLQEVAQSLVSPGKGILAADESFPTIEKRFAKIGLPSTEENRRAYRELLFTTEGIEEFISGVIMFDETLRLASLSQGKPAVQVLTEKGIIPGIKVDQGTEDFPGHPGEKITKGLDGLPDRLKEYIHLEPKFTKWRAIFSIGGALPSDDCINESAKRLGEFAKISQDNGFVPIVEPEVLMEGAHNLEDSEIATTRVLKKVFEELSRNNIDFSGMLLKPNWVHPGLEAPKPTDKEVAEATMRILKEVVPAEVPGIVFLSGGDSPEDSTTHLNALNELGEVPWQLSFSFGRALQEPVLRAWQGKPENVGAAQKEFYKRAKLNSLTRSGKYSKEMENE